MLIFILDKIEARSLDKRIMEARRRLEARLPDPTVSDEVKNEMKRPIGNVELRRFRKSGKIPVQIPARN